MVVGEDTRAGVGVHAEVRHGLEDTFQPSAEPARGFIRPPRDSFLTMQSAYVQQPTRLWQGEHVCAHRVLPFKWETSRCCESPAAVCVPTCSWPPVGGRHLGGQLLLGSVEAHPSLQSCEDPV